MTASLASDGPPELKRDRKESSGRRSMSRNALTVQNGTSVALEGVTMACKAMRPPIRLYMTSLSILNIRADRPDYRRRVAVTGRNEKR